MKKNFLAGLAILLPMVLTVIIVMFFVNLLTKPFMGLVTGIFEKTGLLNRSFFFFQGSQLAFVISKILILFVLFASTLLIGLLIHHFFAHYFFDAFDRIIHKIPIVNKIYKAFQEVMHTLFKSQKQAFSQVVIVPFPQTETYCIGFITKESLPEGSDKEHLDYISVYVPGTPNPLMGFNFLYRREQVHFINMKVDEALKFVISCGVMFPGFEGAKIPL